MKVFISWSGERSKEMANALREWLPMVLQYVEPFVSDKDISAGDRWAQKIAGELESANFGIICITPENLSSEWILFEAGALSKSMLEGKVIPLLFGLELSDLSGPLSQFQAQKVEETGIVEIVKSINRVAENKADEKIIDRAVPALWPELNTALSKIPEIPPTEKHKRSVPDILEEIVTDMRGMNSRMRYFDQFDKSSLMHRRRKRRWHPHMIEELSLMTDTPSASLLILAGLLREDAPWLSEILIESYRQLQLNSTKDKSVILHNLKRTIKELCFGPIAHEILYDSKEMMMIIEELPRFLDKIFHKIID